MAFFGLKLGLDLEMRATHPHQKFQGVPPRDEWLDKVVTGSVFHIVTVHHTLSTVSVLLSFQSLLPTCIMLSISMEWP